MSRQSHSNISMEGGGMGSDHEDDDEDERRCKNRERNKEHARKTRARKKEQLETLRTRMNEIEEENRLLRQSIQECGVASILLGLSGTGGSSCSGENDEILSNADATTSSSLEPNAEPRLSGGKRMRFLSLDEEEPIPQMELNIRGQVTLVGGSGREGKTQINWKTGVYIDEKCKLQQLSKSELETLRRERNRMHAKMTRDRKRCFIASLKRVISKLEEDNQHLRETLERYRATDDHSPDEEKKAESEAGDNPKIAAQELSNSTHSSAFNSSMYTIG